LTNPANASHQMMGVYSRDFVEPMTEVLKNLGLKRALVVHGNDGLDEITTADSTFVSEFNGRDVVSYHIDPEELGITRASHDALRGEGLEDNVMIAVDILNGQKGPKRDIVLVNAAYALYTVGKVKNINEGVALAEVSIDSGKALEKLNQLKEFTHRGQ
jgi:anthranilate phosphoribosyltransferase